ncbi:unnamed protein product, partial [Iphiclides podalirius]
MQVEGDGNKILLPHHEQLPLCTSRLAYRQGRKLTAVKVYTVASESNHLLVFGVPALNLRQETKALFMKFGKLVKFNISPDHPSEAFTETYHSQYERIQSARVAKRMLDTKNFYGGSLHVCYAPEMESVDETRKKLWQRQKDVLYRLRNLPLTVDKPEEKKDENLFEELPKDKKVVKLDMGQANTISLGKKPKLSKNKRIREALDKFKRFKPCFVDTAIEDANTSSRIETKVGTSIDKEFNNETLVERDPVHYKNIKRKHNDMPVEVIDCTSVDSEVVTNINEHLNYDKFGTEDIREMPKKRANKIVFHINKNS